MVVYKDNIKRSLYFILFIIAYQTLEQLRVLFPISSGYLILLLLGCGIFIIEDKNVIRRYFFPTWLVYSIIVLINYELGDSYFSKLGPNLGLLLYMFLTAEIAFYCLGYDKEKLMSWILIVFFVLLIYITICSYLLNLEEPEIIRHATAQGFGGDTSLLVSSYRKGMSNYYLPHALPMIIPLFVYLIKKKEMNVYLRVGSIILLSFVLLLVYISGAVTAMLISVVMIIITLSMKSGSIRDNLRRIIILSLIALPLLFSSSVQIFLMDFVSGFIEEGSQLSKKIELFKEILDLGYATGDLEERIDLYNESVNILNTNPLWGTNDPVGGHSAILDRLASLGLFGLIPYVLMIYFQIDFCLKHISADMRLYYLLGVSTGIIMLFAKSMDNWETWLIMFTILPFLTHKIGLISNSNNSLPFYAF